MHKFESLSFQEQMDKSATTAISKGAMKRFLHNLVKARSCVPQSLEGDYNTLGTKFVKAVTRNQNRYAHKKRITRNEMAAKRKETLQKQAQAK